ncbi:MAG: sodium:proton antiporter [Candidatus Pacebacteria bacterium]|nr:sodium:proton antiporter [Candidatus Paceibacterota bacterium]
MTAIPFIGLILAFAVMPIVTPKFWHHHWLGLSLGWIAAGLIFNLIFSQADHYWLHIAEVMIVEYLPFIVVISSLYIIAGGIRLEGKFGGTPLRNSITLAIGGVFASVIGTTAAALIFTRTLIDNNRHRAFTSHIFLFVIVIVGNIGGSLTPVGDPPLLIGYLQGIPFLWFGQNLWPMFLFMMVSLITIFFGVDFLYFRKHPSSLAKTKFRFKTVRIVGWYNLVLLSLVVLSTLLIPSFIPTQSMTIFALAVPLKTVLMVLVVVAITGFSLLVTSRSLYSENRFSYIPLIEVIVLFFGIFATITPVLGLVKSLPLGDIMLSEHRNSYFFWGSGLFSSVLDNSPTFIIFMTLMGQNIGQIIDSLPLILVALCCGTVFMGALTYIGNAPNLLVRNLVEAEKIKMPNFFTYSFYAVALLIPLFILLDWLFL